VLAALAIAWFAPSAGGLTHVPTDVGESAVAGHQVRVADPAVLPSSDVATRLVASGKSVPEAPFLRIVAILAGLGIAAYASSRRRRTGVVTRVRPGLGRRDAISPRGPPRVAF
jgi:hypothetical protein